MDLSPIEMNDTKDNINFIYYVIEVVPSMFNVTLVCLFIIKFVVTLIFFN